MYIGKLDKEIYGCVSREIVSENVIITEERIKHIMQRHPNDFEQYYSYIPQIICKPDYIIESKKENTAVILKEIKKGGEKFKLILKLKIEKEPIGYENSIISFWKIGETTWQKTLKNKKVLYKKY